MPFQYQNGTIKRDLIERLKKINIKFQYQNGTIKSRPTLRKDTKVFVFQYQNGTIKSLIFTAIGLITLNFNTKTVQLKELKAKAKSEVEEFQYQNGTIKSNTNTTA